jgi:nitronate monooxygenase
VTTWQRTVAATRLGIEYPIVQGPFGGGLSSVDLVVAVSESGGLGSYGAFALTPDEIRALAAEIRSRTSKPFALNLWISNHDPGGLGMTTEQHAAGVARFARFYEELGVAPPPPPVQPLAQNVGAQVEALLEALPPVFSFVFGLPSHEVIDECRRRGIVTMATITTIDEAIAAEQAGVDLIVASGFEAGGHRISFLRPAEESLVGTMALVPTVVDRVTIPVIAAGGIADGRGIAAALALGASGVQIGTAFLACDESGAPPIHRERLFSDEAKYTGLTRAFTGRLARGLRNTLMAAGDEMTERLPYPAQGFFASSFRKAAIEQGRWELMSLWAGQAAPLLKHRKARQLFEALVHETGTLAQQRRHEIL